MSKPSSNEASNNNNNNNNNNNHNTSATKKVWTSSYRTFYAVRACPALEQPAIFYHELDRDAVIAATDAMTRVFDDVEEAHDWICMTKVPHTKSRKRKASLMINPAPNQRQEQNNQKWEEKFAELIKFTETIGDGDPNLALSKEYHRPDLAAFLGHQRQDYSQYLAGKIPSTSLVDRKTRYLRLLEVGVRLHQEKSYTWPTQAQKWKDFVTDNPAMPLLTTDNDPKIVELAEWQDKQIQEYVKMMRKETPHEMLPHRLQKLKDWNFPFPKNVSVPKKVTLTFDERLQEFVNWKEEHGTPLVPQSTKGLGEWVKEQRKEYRKHSKGQKAYINEERIDKLKNAGFVFEVRKRSSTGTEGGGGDSTTSDPTTHTAKNGNDDDDDTRATTATTTSPTKQPVHEEPATTASPESAAEEAALAASSSSPPPALQPTNEGEDDGEDDVDPPSSSVSDEVAAAANAVDV